jgi:hypothetical protein
MSKAPVVSVAVALCLGIVLGFVTEHRFSRTPVPQTDTLRIWDTVTVDSPLPESIVPAGFELVPAGTSQQLRRYFATIEELQDSLARGPELVYVHDTAFIVVPLQDYKFGDGKTYEMLVRGYDVDLLWHKSFTETDVVTKTEPVFRDFKWTLYPSAAVFAIPGVAGASLGLGADISISSDRRLRFVPEAGYGAFYAGGDIRFGPFARGSVRFNIVQAK